MSVALANPTKMSSAAPGTRTFPNVSIRSGAAFLLEEDLHPGGIREQRQIGDRFRGLGPLDVRRNRPPDFAERQSHRDADQHRPADSAPVRDRRLLGLPARARPREPGARRHDRLAGRQHRPRPDAAHRRAGRTRGGTTAAPVGRRRDAASALQVLPRSGRRSVSLVSGCADRRSRPAAGRAGRCRRSSRASSRPTMCGCSSWRRRSSRRRSARRVRSARWPRRRTSGCARCRRTSGGAGTRKPRPCSARSIRSCGGELDNNPVALLQQIPIDKLEERASQLALHSRINNAYRRMQEYLRSKHTWGARHAGVLWARPVAYFSAEFGLHESLPIYSGGLGILAGDHIKAASDLGIPLVGVGLYYDQGYFKQRLDRDGWQHEDYIHVDHRVLPIRPALSEGTPILIAIETRTGTIVARVWQVSVGRNTLLLLDSDVEGNLPEDRALTARLYGGDERVRIRQELLLGVGGIRALTAAGIVPGVLHLNEGHSAFAGLELVRQRMADEGIDAWEALRRVAAQVVFTTHTPVPAGHDRFSSSLIEEHLGPLGEALGLDHDRAHGTRAREIRKRRRRLLHDGAGAQDVPPRQRGVLAARTGLSHDVDAALSRTDRGPRADRPHHQRRARADVARAADAPGLRPSSRPGLAGAGRRSGFLGARRRDRRWGVVGDAPDAEGAAHRHRQAARGAAGANGAAIRRSSSRSCRRALSPRRAHHRLRAPVRHLQARQPDSPGPGDDRVARQSRADADSARVRRQIASARCARASRSCSRSPS